MSEVSDVLARVSLPEPIAGYARRFATFDKVWENCTRADWMLEMLEALQVRKPRGLREFVCRCGRRWAHFMKDVRSRRALDAGEKYARGEISLAALEFLRPGAESAALELADETRPIVSRAAHLAVLALEPNVYEAAKQASRIAALAEHAVNDTMSDLHEDMILAEQAKWLKELLGNPFLRPQPAAPQAPTQ
jgi:hypothetical protein